MTDLNWLTIREAHRLLSRREISSVELTRACLERIESVEDRVGAFLAITPDLAMEQAEKADRSLSSNGGGPLTGIPVQVKDVMCTRGIPTTCGSRMLEDYVPVYDSTAVARLLDRGAVVLGKGNMDEFAMGSSCENSAFHPARNPWDLDRVPGGSSGGGSASVASAEAVYALGSDTGGSVRQPAAMCGVVGMKPSYGLVSRYGLVAYASSLDQIGPIGRSVEDCALVLNAIAGHDPRDSTSLPGPAPDYLSRIENEIAGLRLGLPSEYFSEGVETGVREAVETAAKALEALGASVQEVSLPTTRYALACYYIIAPAECSANLARYDGVKYGASYQDAGDMWEAMERTRQYGFGPEVDPARHARNVCVVGRLLRRLLPEGATGPDFDPPRLCPRLRDGGRLGDSHLASGGLSLGREDGGPGANVPDRRLHPAGQHRRTSRPIGALRLLPRPSGGDAAHRPALGGCNAAAHRPRLPAGDKLARSQAAAIAGRKKRPDRLARALILSDVNVSPPE